MVPIVVLASGRGSNFESIQKAIERGELAADLIAVISDRPDSGVLSKARDLGIPALSIPFHSRLDHENRILNVLEQLNPKFLVLAGYMRIISPRIIEKFRSERGYSRIVNIHPSILPAFSGIQGYAQAFQYGAKVTGVTVHLVERELDSGPICHQQAFSIADCKSESEVEQKGLVVEHWLYPETLKWVLPERFSIEKRLPGGRLSVRPN